MTDQWTCPQCQHMNPQEMRFCPNCGAANPVLTAAANSESDRARLAAGYRRLVWTVAIALWVGGCAVLAVAGGIWWGRQDARDYGGSSVAGVTASPPSTSTPRPPAPSAEPTSTPTMSPSPTSAATLEANEAGSHSASDFLQMEPAGQENIAASTGDTLTVPSSSRPPRSDDILVSPDSASTDPTPSPTPQPTVVAPTSTPVTAPTCPTPGVQITSPAPGSTFTRRTNYIVGLANIPRFHHWRIEYSTDPNGGWNYLMERDYPVDNDKLMMLDASTVPRGPYGLRLTVVDETGNYPEPCEVWFTNAN